MGGDSEEDTWELLEGIVTVFINRHSESFIHYALHPRLLSNIPEEKVGRPAPRKPEPVLPSPKH